MSTIVPLTISWDKFSKSIKTICKSVLLHRNHSISQQSNYIVTIVDCPSKNPNCFFDILTCIQLSFPKAPWYGNVFYFMLLEQLWISSLFLRRGTKLLFLHSFGIFLVCQVLLKRFVSHLIYISPMYHQTSIGNHLDQLLSSISSSSEPL